MRIFSYGGGVQSFAVLVLTTQQKLFYDAFLFCNVGEDSENPDTLVHVNEIAKPLADKHGIEFIELIKMRKGEQETVLSRATRPGSRSVPIPARMNGNGAPGRRSCTVDFKINLVARWLKKNGATVDKPATVGLGISLDEMQRARTASGIKWELLEYPLIDLRLTRQACVNIIQQAGLVVPPKSSCFFCPFHSMNVWREMKKNQPDLFQKSVELERHINSVRKSLDRDPVWLSGGLRPLDEVVGDQVQSDFFDIISDDACESGYCMV